MSVYKPAKSRFFQYDFVIGKKRFHGSTGQVTRRAAEKAEERLRREAGEGKLGAPSEFTLDQAAGRWWDDIGQHRGDALDTERRLEVLVGLIGKHTRLVDIDTDVVARAMQARRATPFYKSKKEGAKAYYPAPATVNRDVIETLRPVLKYAAAVWEAKGLRLRVIAWHTLKLATPAGRVKLYSEAEQAAWMAECGPTVGLALDLLLTYGPRFGELFFALDDFEPEGPRVRIQRHARGKEADIAPGRKRDTGAHTWPLTKAHGREIAARVGRARKAGLEHIWYVEEVVDHGPRKGEVDLVALTYYGLHARLRSAAKRAKVTPGAIIHGARHHAGSAIVRKTGDVTAAKRLLGHTDIKSTMRYVHVLEDQVRAALEGKGNGAAKAAGGKARDRVRRS